MVPAWSRLGPHPVYQTAKRAVRCAGTEGHQRMPARECTVQPVKVLHHGLQRLTIYDIAKVQRSPTFLRFEDRLNFFLDRGLVLPECLLTLFALGFGVFQFSNPLIQFLIRRFPSHSYNLCLPSPLKPVLPTENLVWPYCILTFLLWDG